MKLKQFAVVCALVLLSSFAAFADSGTVTGNAGSINPANASDVAAVYDISGTASFLSQGQTESVTFAFEFTEYSEASGMGVLVTGPFSLTSSGPLDEFTGVAGGNFGYFAITNADGDEVDLNGNYQYRFPPGFGTPSVYACGSQVCANLFPAPSPNTPPTKLIEYYGTLSNLSVNLVQTPEPNTIAMLLFGIALLQYGYWSRRRNSNA